MKKLKRMLILVLCLGVTFFAVNFVSGYFSNRVKIYIKQKAILNTANLIEDTIKKEVLPAIQVDKLIFLNTNENKQVQNVLINTHQVNQIMALINESLYDKIQKIESKEELNHLSLPLGMILSDTLFGSRGPSINIRIAPLGSVKSDVVTSVKDYGINSSILNIDIVVKIVFQTMIPLNKEEIEVITKIPIVVQVINSDVPKYYYYGSGGLDKAPVDFE